MRNLTLLPNHSDASLLLSDAGFLHGDGVMETIRVFHGKPVWLSAHLARLRKGAESCRIEVPWADEAMALSLEALLHKNKADSAVLNLYVTAGVFRGMPPVPALYGVVRPFPLVRSVTLAIASTPPRTTYSAVKMMGQSSRFSLLRDYPDVDDLLLVDDQEVFETTIATAFFVKDEILYTSNSPYVLPGIFRQFILDNPKIFGKTICRPILLSELGDFDEIFLTTAVRGVVMVQKVEGIPHLGSGSVSHSLLDKTPYLSDIHGVCSSAS